MNRSCNAILRLLLVIGTLLLATAGAWSAQQNIVAIQGGGQHVLALRADGSVFAWGTNTSNQATVPDTALAGVTAVAGGGSHSLALKADGTVVAWGSNTNGQATPPANLNGAIAVAAGGSHSLALKGDGTVVAWGSNSSNQATVPGGLSRVIAIAAGGNHSLALKRNGTVVAWGSNASNQTAIPENLTGVIAIAAGDSHSLALKSDGTVVAWGLNTSNQTTIPYNLADVVAIAAGGNHSVALKSNGTVAAWGSNPSNQTTVPGGLANVVAITAGADYSLTLKSDGDLVHWGAATTTPNLTTASTYNRLAGGTSHSLMVTEAGTLLAWGANTYGQTTIPNGWGDAWYYDEDLAEWVYDYIYLPSRDATTGVVSVAAGDIHSLALKAGGNVIAWGGNTKTQTEVPDGWVDGSYYPEQDATIDVSAVAAGKNHCLALKSGGRVIAWGDNLYTQTTVPAEALSGIKAIAGGDRFSLALTSGGKVIAWGSPQYGETTVPVAAQSGVTAIAAGTTSALALKSDGSVVVWGYLTPYTPAGLGSVVKIAAGKDHALALTKGGNIVAWGSEVETILNPDRNLNIPATAQSSVLDIAAGSSHSLALKASDEVIAWGDSNNGKTTVPTIPVTKYTVSIDDNTGTNLVLLPSTSIQGIANTYVLARIAYPDGAHLPQVSGCGGTLKGQIYQTAPLTADCTITVEPFVDTSPPSITDVLPANGANVTTGLITISGIADDDIGIASLTLDFNGSTYPITVNADGSFEKTVSMPTPALYSYQLTATDAGGNSTSVEQNLTYVTGWVKINDGATATKLPAVSLTFNYPPGAKDMRLLYNGTAWGAWEAYTSPKSINLPTGDGLKTVAVQFRTAGGNVSDIYSSSIYLSSTAISGTIAINGGAESVKSATSPTRTNVTLSLSVAAPVEPVTMRFSTNNKVSWSDPYPFASTWDLSVDSGIGSRTVNVEFKDAGGQTIIASDSILLTLSAPLDGTAGGVSINDGAEYTTSTAVKLYLTPPDGSYTYVRFPTSSSMGTWATYTSPKSFTLPAGGDGVKTVHAQFAKSSTGTSATGLYSDTIILDMTVPKGRVLINGGDVSTNSTSVNLTLAAADANGIDYVEVSNNGTLWTKYKPFTTEVNNWDLPGGSGTKTVSARFMDKAGKLSAVTKDTIILDTAAPAGTIKINNGAAYTASVNVQLNIAAAAGSGALYMQFSTDNSTWSDWEPYATTTSLTLPAGDGTKTVYVRFKDLAGNISTSAASDTIILDTTAPVLTLQINGDAAWTNKNAVTLTLEVDDANPAAKMQFSNDNKTWTALATYTATKAWTLLAGTGARTVYARVTDGAGNPSETVSADITIDTVKPTGTVVINGGDPLTNSAEVTLTLDAADDPTGSGIATMQFSNNGSAWSVPPLPYGTSAPWTMTNTSGLRTVYVRFLDHAGNISLTMKDTITLDSTAPALTMATYPALLVVNNSFTVTGTNEVGATLQVQAPDGVTAELTQPSTSTWSCAVSGLAEGINDIIVTATDGAGNTATKTASVTYAPYRNSDLSGTWNLEGISSAGPPEGIASGTLVIGDDGAITGGTLIRHNQTEWAIDSGMLNISSVGVVSGSISTDEPLTLTITGAALDSSKKLLALTVGTSDDERQLLLVTRQTSGVATADLAGQWTYVGAATGAPDDSKNGNLKGAFTLNSDGVMSTASYKLNIAAQTTMTGSLTSDASGNLTGSMTSGGTTITLDKGALHDDKQMLQFVATSSLDQSILITALRNGGTFTVADTTGTWRLYGLAASGSGEGSLDGQITVTAGKVTAGSVHQLPSGTLTDYNGGSLVMGSTGTFTGKLTIGTTVAVTIEAGKMHSSKQLMTLIGKTADNSRIYLVGIKEPQ